jgi:Alw26I/Eco31I/Esp3I family type II restriction endonuclease
MENTDGLNPQPEFTPPSNIRYGDKRRPWSDAFVKYMYVIVNHPNYQGMPAAIDETGQIRWMAPSKRPSGTKHEFLHDERLVWWQQKADEIGEPRIGKWPSRVAKKIHPLREKPCQTCGRVMSLDRIYPTQLTVQKINRLLPLDAQIKYADFHTVYEIVEHVIETIGNPGYDAIEKIFPQIKGCEQSIKKFQKAIREQVVPFEPRSLSPGSMADAPDRLDGFHTYNICCRSKQDKGRDSDNMRLYGVDRRAFEQWTEGNWAAADTLMHRATKGECQRRNCRKNEDLTADHIGPISLGFMHRPRFLAVCHSCNSAKNNRMNLDDVHLLLTDEHSGDQVISRQARTLWDRLKEAIQSDNDAKKLSFLLRINQHYYLMLLYRIYIAGYPDILLHLLKPEYADESFKFINVHPGTFEYEEMILSPRKLTFAKSKAGRMVRISFDVLKVYAQKENRNIHSVPEELLQPIDSVLFESLSRYSSVCVEFRKNLLSVLNSSSKDEIRDRNLWQLLGQKCIDIDASKEIFALMSKYMDSVGNWLADVFLGKEQTKSNQRAINELFKVGQEMLSTDKELPLSEQSDVVQKNLWTDDRPH